MAQAFRLGDWQIEPQLGRASKGDRMVHLRAKVMDLLVFLVERPGQVVSKDELLNGVWHTEFVSESALTRVVTELRQAFGDDVERPWLIETIPKRGYRLIAPVVVTGESVAGSVAGTEATSRIIDSDARSGRRLFWPWAAVTGLALAAAGLFLAVFVLRDSLSFGAPPADERIRLAVLPFSNLSDDPAQEYFADGLTEELISQIGRLQPQRLGVIARTSAMRYKSGDRRVDEIGRDLGVRYVVEGSVRRVAGRLRVTARLVRAADQLDLWVETYDLTLPEVFALQRDIAVRVSRSLALTLLGDEPTSPQLRARTTTPEAYETYLLGLFQYHKATEHGARKSAEYFTQAISLDPGYAPPYARLAFSHTFLASGNFASDRETYPKASEAARKALEIDDGLADAHTARGFVKWRFDWDWEGARKDIERGLELDPNSPSAHHIFGLYLYSTGAFDRAIAEMKSALELDPLAPLTRWNLGRILLAAGQRPAAVREFRRALEIEPAFSWPHRGLGQALLEQGLYEEAISEIQTATRLAGGERFAADLAYAYALAGKRPQAEAIARRLAEQHDPPGYELGAVHLALGNTSEALTWLERAHSARDDNLVYFKVAKIFDPLRAHPAFQDLIRRVGIPD
jgi:TolB-like protein/DNA-binding winged helix-turn-helix (wHTH) protein/Tfp pilus assembly protein PilF